MASDVVSDMYGRESVRRMVPDMLLLRMGVSELSYIGRSGKLAKVALGADVSPLNLIAE